MLGRRLFLHTGHQGESKDAPAAQQRGEASRSSGTWEKRHSEIEAQQAPKGPHLPHQVVMAKIIAVASDVRQSPTAPVRSLAEGKDGL